MKRLFFVFPLACLAILFIVTVVYASCVLIAPPGRDIAGVAQRSIIIFDKENERVDLVPQISFRGNTIDFAIVVATPTEPQLKPVNSQVFWDASFLTQPITRQGESGCSCNDDNMIITAPQSAGFRNLSDSEVVNEGVNVIREETVGAFGATILTADDPDALIDWLTENGYTQFDSDDVDILNKYIQDDWYFTAMKIDTMTIPGWWRDFDNFSAGIDPVMFSYEATELIYPLELTSISVDKGNDVLIYTISKHKMNFKDADVEYANKMTKEELEAVSSQYPAFYGLLWKDAFVTKLRRNFHVSEMNTDLNIDQAPNDDEFRDVRYSGFPFSTSLLISIAALGYYLFRRGLSSN